MSLRISLALAFLGVIGVGAHADNWPRFRGRNADGVVADDPRLPDTWSKTENVKWVIDTAGRGWGSPVVVGDRVFLTSVVSDGDDTAPKAGLYLGQGVKTPPKGIHHWLVYCFDLKSGKLLWKHEAHKGQPKVPRHPKSSYGAETPATDGERLYVLFGDVGLYCYDLTGKPLWSHAIEPKKTLSNFGAASSPVVHDGQVFVVYDNMEESYLASFDAQTGKRIWQTKRDESSTWATPFIWQHEGRTEIVTCGKKKNRSYDLKGNLLWEFDGKMSNLVIPSPFVADGLLYITSGYVGDRHRPVYAVEPGATGDISLKEGENSNEHIVWYQPKAGPYNTSPLVVGGRYYTLLDRGFLTCHDAKTGKEIFDRERIGGTYTASPWAYNGKLFCLGEDGKTRVLTAGAEYDMIGTNDLDELCLATPAIADGHLLIRTASKLYCITSGPPAKESKEAAKAEWTQSYKAGYVDGRGRYAGGSEILHLEGHEGKLYAANSYWMDPSNIWYGGNDPKTPWSQILRLDSPDGEWEVDLELGPNNLRAENLKSVTFGTDGSGKSLEEPVTLLIATAYSPNPQGADINVFVRDDDTGKWEKTVLLSGTGESGENNSTRCMTVYRDRVTGVDRLFLPVGLLGIFTGVYDADVPGRIRWDKTPETGRLDKRSLAIIEANDSLVYSSGTKIYRRNDGPTPTHSVIFDASQLSKGPVASPVGGVRGLSVIPNPKGTGESLLFVWAPDSKSRSCVVRLDQDETGKYLHTKEECVADLMSEYLSGNPVYYALAGYNNILPVLNPATKESAYLMGFECWVGGRQFPCWQGNERGGFYAGAMYAIRDKNAQYWLNEVNGPATVEKSPLQSVRTYEISPFKSEKGRVIYFGGFVADHGPSHNTAWVYKTSIENALRKDSPRPVRLTPEQTKAQLAALRQPYRFEHRDKPAFTIEIPGEFARGEATGGNVFHANKAFNTLSISISQSEIPEQAAKQYVEALKRAGNGTAELVKQSTTKLPDGTPAMEFVATWVTKQNARQTTQALTACKDGHAVTIATHTWEVGLPNKSFFFTLKFEPHGNTEK